MLQLPTVDELAHSHCSLYHVQNGQKFEFPARCRQQIAHDQLLNGETAAPEHGTSHTEGQHKTGNITDRHFDLEKCVINARYLKE